MADTTIDSWTSPHRRRAVITDAVIATVALVLDLLIYFGNLSEPVSAVAIVAICCSNVALAFRRYAPLPVFGIVWLVAMGAVVLEDLQTFIGPLVMIFTVAELFAAQTALGGLVVMYVAFIARSVHASAHDPIGLAFGLGFYGVFSVAAWFAGRFRRRSREHVQRLEAEHERAAEEAVRQERLRLSRELHDIVSHTVNVMTLQAAGARAVMDSSPERVSAALDVIEHSGVQAMNELHRLLQLLRSQEPSEATLTVQPRLSDLPELIDLARQSGQHIRLDLNGHAGELDPSVELAVFRVVQESLTNARKYAGQDAEVSVQLEWLPPRLVVTVANDPGTAARRDQLAALSTGHGLVGLAERVQLAGGELETGPTDRGGYRVRAVLPVSAMRQPEHEDASSGPRAWESFD